MIKVRHIRSENYITGNYDSGAITIVSKINYGNPNINGETYPRSIEFAVACSSIHDEFIKKIGREIATTRLLNRDINFYRKLNINIERKLFAWEINQLIDINILYTMKISHRAYEIMFDRLRLFGY